MFQFRDFQIKGINQVAALAGQGIRKIVFQAATGAGKCLGKDTPVMLFNGHIVPVQEVVPGDTLMGDDSTPRKVLSTTTGSEQLYRITPVKGDPYIVNESHMLSLKMTGNKGRTNGHKPGDIVDISVRDYLLQNNTFKHCAKGFRVPVLFKTQKLGMPPYMLGVWLGDGNSRKFGITTTDKEIINEVRKYAKSIGCRVRDEITDGKCPNYYIREPTSKGYKGGGNPTLNFLKKENLILNKHIPHKYKATTRKNRLELLAGLIDTDGSLSHSGYDIISKREVLADDICFVARSLGLAAYKSMCQKTCYNNGVTGTYYRVSISGDTSIIPVRIAYKKAPTRKQKKNVLHVGIKVEPIGIGDYYGFEITGNGRFLLGDFTVTHNTVLFAGLVQRFLKKYPDAKVVIAVHRVELLKQTVKALHRVTGIEAAMLIAGHNTPVREVNNYTIPHSTARVIVCMVETLHRRFTKYKQYMGDIQMLIVDECIPYDQFVITEKGKTKIGVLCRWAQEGKKLPLVLSHNTKTQENEFKQILDISNNGEKGVLKIKCSQGGLFSATPNHPFLTTTGWTEAGCLKIGDCVLTTSPGHGFYLIPNKDQVEFIQGGLLGDASVDKTRKTINVNRFKFIHGEQQKEYIEWKARVLGCNIRKIQKNGYAQKVAYTFSSKVLYIQDKTIDKENIIQNISYKSLAIAWMDDGNLGAGFNIGSLYSTATSPTLSALLLAKLLSLGIACKFKIQKSSTSQKEYCLIRFSREGVHRFCKRIAPYVHPSMSYKIPPRYRSLCGTYNWDTEYSKLGGGVITNIQDAGILPTFNMQVADNETFTLATLKNTGRGEKYNGAIVHNCHRGEFNKIYDHFPESLIIGFTATPLSADKRKPMKLYFEEIVSPVTINELIAQGHLAKNITIAIKGAVNRKKLAVRGGEFDEQAMATIYSSAKHVENCLKAYEKYCMGEKTLVFNCNIAHSLLVNQAFVDAGYNSRHMDGLASKEERTDILEWFANTHDAILQNVGLYTTGLDEPTIINGIVNRATMSLPLWIQTAGRAARSIPGVKDHFKIIDLGMNEASLLDWNYPHDWVQYFKHPERARPKKGVAPTKICPKCESIIHISCKLCPECGEDLSGPPEEYDLAAIDLEVLTSGIDIEAIIKNNEMYKPYRALHIAKAGLVKNFRQQYRHQFCAQNVREELNNRYQQLVKKWCIEQKKDYNKWHKDTTKAWLMAALDVIYGKIPDSLQRKEPA